MGGDGTANKSTGVSESAPRLVGNSGRLSSTWGTGGMHTAAQERGTWWTMESWWGYREPEAWRSHAHC
jgi:hypothetical protein